jgi:hypothetical protein
MRPIRRRHFLAGAAVIWLVTSVSEVIVTPGSPNLPVRHGTVALLTFTENVDVEIVHLPT